MKLSIQDIKIRSDSVSGVTRAAARRGRHAILLRVQVPLYSLPICCDVLPVLLVCIELFLHSAYHYTFGI
jgi:hypothetical protein